MKVPSRPFGMIPWGESLLDKRLDQLLTQWASVVEIYLSTRDPSPTAGCEFFTCGSQGKDVGWLIERCNALDMGIILNLDIHDGNGRKTTDSPCASGSYHHAIIEGGSGGHSYRGAIDKILKWPKHLLANVVGFQWTNEPIDKDWLASWIAERMQERAAKLRARGWLNVISAGDHHLDHCAHMAQVLDPHDLFETPAQAGAAVADLQKRYPKHEHWVTELTADVAQQTLEITNAVIASGAEAAACFGGHGLEEGGKPVFDGKFILWNGRNRRNYVAESGNGTTVTGAELYDFWNVDGAAPPIDPPEPPVEPPEPPIKPPPDDSVNLNKVRTQNQKAIGALEKDPPRVNDALGILRRQAKTLGI